MNGDPNPYRFTGGAPERPAPLRAPLSLERLVWIARYRLFLAGATVAYYAGVGGAIAFAIAASDNPRLAAELSSYVFLFGSGSVVALFVVGAVFVPWVSPERGVLKTLALLAPFVNAVVVLVVLADARRELRSRGVRVGLLSCNFSQAVPDPPLP